MTREVVVVGGGPAGLAGAFWRLFDDPACRVTVVEAAPQPGGWVRTEERAGYLCETGPQAVRPGPEIDELVAALGAGAELMPASPLARARWIGRGGRLWRVPAGPGGLLATPLFSLRGKLRLLREPFVTRGGGDGESVAAFVRRRFGPESEPLVQAMVAGIFAGEAERLEVASAFPALCAAERTSGSVLRGLLQQARHRRRPRVRRPALYTFRGGMAGLVRLLVTALGDRVRTGTPASAVAGDRGRWRVTLAGGGALAADELVLACSARASSRLLGALDPGLARELEGIAYASVASVFLGFPAERLPATLQGFGFLLEPDECSPVLGAIYCHSVFEGHAPPGHGLVRVMLGGTRHPGIVDLADDALAGLAEDAVRRYAGLRGPVVFQHVARAGAAVPQYEPGHGERLARLAQCLTRHPGLSLRGNSYRALALAGQLGRASGTDVAGRDAAAHAPA